MSENIGQNLQTIGSVGVDMSVSQSQPIRFCDTTCAGGGIQV